MSDTAITQYGFTMGPATVTRIHNSPTHGAFLDVSGVRERIEIRVTKGGRLRVGPVIKISENKTPAVEGRASNNNKQKIHP